MNNNIINIIIHNYEIIFSKESNKLNIDDFLFKKFYIIKYPKNKIINMVHNIFMYFLLFFHR